MAADSGTYTVSVWLWPRAKYCTNIGNSVLSGRTVRTLQRVLSVTCGGRIEEDEDE